MKHTIAAISAAHGRENITRAWAIHTASLGFSSVVVAVSDDEDNDNNAAVLNDAGIAVIRRPNRPLSHKFQSALEACPSADLYMIVPSDDFVHPSWVMAAANSTHHYSAPAPMAMYDTQSGEALRISSPFHPTTGRLVYGACRVFSHAIRERVRPLWPGRHDRGLDSTSHLAIMLGGDAPHVERLDQIAFTDIKGRGNIWGFEFYRKAAEPMGAAEATAHITDPAARMLLGLPSGARTP